MRYLLLALYLSMSLSSCKHTETTAADTKGVVGQGCSSKVAAGSCEFYNCFESEFKCGDAGYPIGYGKRYCERFQNLCGNSLTGQKARQWVAGTMKCLQVALVVREKQLTSCSAVTDYAFDSHPDCYTTGSVDNGGVSFCSLNPLEWNSIRTCVNATDRLSVIGLKQIAATALRCNKFFLSALFLDGGPDAGPPDPETAQMIASMSPAEREARAAEFLDFANAILKE